MVSKSGLSNISVDGRNYDGVPVVVGLDNRKEMCEIYWERNTGGQQKINRVSNKEVR